MIQKQLSQAVTTVSKFISSKSVMPILTGMKVFAIGNTLNLSATDLESAINHALFGYDGCSFETVVPGRLFANYLASLPNEDVNLLFDEKRLTVVCGNFTANFNCMDAGDYPQLPEATVDTSLEVRDLGKAVSQVAHAACKDDTRPVLQGMYLDGKNLVTADGFRLAKTEIECELPNCIVPAKLLHAATKAMNGDSMNLGVDKNHLMLMGDTANVSIRLIAGSFPNYQQIFPKEFKTQVVAKSADLLGALRLANLLSDAVDMVNLKVNGTLIISSKSNEQGDNQAEVNAEITGEPVSIWANGRYMMEAIQGADSEVVTLKMNEKDKPLVIESGCYSSIVMPMHKKE